MFLGIVIIIIGVFALLKNVGLIVLPFSLWSIVYPVLLIVVGACLVTLAMRARMYWQEIKRFEFLSILSGGSWLLKKIFNKKKKKGAEEE